MNSILAPDAEDARLAALRSHGVLDTPAEAAFDEITTLAAAICETPMAMICLVDESRQWFKSKVGIGVDETPREQAFCAHALSGEDLLVVADTLLDDRFAGNPLVLGEPWIRFYAGAPLIAEEGKILGALCVCDRVPRHLTDRQHQALRALSRQVMTQMRLQRTEAVLQRTVEDRERTELALRKSEAEQRQLARRLIEAQVAGNVGSWETDLATRKVQWSAQTHRIFETTPETFEPTHPNFLERVHPEDRAAVDAAFVSSLAAGSPSSIEHRIVMEDGRVKHVEEHWQAFSDAEGRPVRAIGTCQDITERRRAEEERDRLFNLSMDLLSIASFDGNLEQVNPAWTECLGWSAAEMTSQPWLHFVHPDDHEATIHAGKELTQGRPVRDFENRYRCKDGSYRWLSWNAHPLMALRQTFSVARDVTERKRAEAALQDQAALLASAQRIGLMGSWTLDVKSGHLEWPAATCELFGISPGEFTHTAAHFESFIMEEDRAAVARARADAPAKDGILEVEYRIRRPDGEVRWMHDRGHMEFDAEGNQARRLGMVTDITERKQALENLQRLNRLYAVSSSINEAIARIQDTQQLYEQTCRIAVEQGGLVMAWAGVLEPGCDKVKMVATHGNGEGFLDGLEVSVRLEPLGMGPSGRALRENQMVFCNDIATDPCLEPWRARALARGYGSCAAFPLRVAGQPIGVYTVYGDRPGYFKEEEFRFLTAMADNLSFAVESHQREKLRMLTEEALHASEASMAAAQRIGHFGSWELDFAREESGVATRLRWSDEMFRIAGYQPGAVEVTREFFFSLVHPDDRESVRQTVAGSVRERHQYDIAHRLVRLDGEERIVHETAQIFFDENTGRPVKMIGTAHDITEQRRAEEALQESEERFRSFMTHSPVAGWIVDVEGRFSYLSPGYYTMFGAGTDDLTGRMIQDVYEPALAEVYLEGNRAVLRQQSAAEFVLPGTRWDGSPGEFLVAKFPIVMPGREPLLGAIALDITEQRQAEKTLRESEARFRSYFELPLHGIAVTSLEKGFVQVNDRICSILGYDRDELMAMSWAELTYPADLDADVLQFNRLVCGEIDRYDMEKRFIRKDGNVIWTSIGVGGIRNPDGSMAYLVGIMVDITERKQAEEDLRESEQRFRQLAENINEVFWLTDPAMNKTLYVSPAYERIWGRSCESLYHASNSWLDAIHPNDRGRVHEAISNRRGNGGFAETYRIIRPDGSLRWIRDRAYPVRNEKGGIYRMVGTAEDITERREADEKLREQATLLDKAQDAIVVRDLDHRIRYWNRSAERLYGWMAEEAVGRSILDLLYRDSEPFLAAMAITLAAGEWVGEIRQVNKEGRALVVEARWTLVRDDQGRPKSVLAINTDITERRNLEQQFLRAQRMESIGTLAGGIAHDLNNVLAPIMMSIDLLRLKETDEGRAAILSTIESSAKRGADMVRQVLSFARGVTGQQVEVQVAGLVVEVVKIANETFLKSIRVRSEVPPDLWTVEGDPTQLHQVLLNLCVNARDTMPDGGLLTITASNVVLDEQYAGMNIEARPGPHVVIQVEDAGTGIAPEVLDRIFEPFFTTKETGKGTGLGLSTTLAIIKSHGGFVRVYSELGVGTKFRVYFPAHDSPGAAPAVAVGSELPRGNSELVLVVDDEAAVRQITQQTLEAFGYRVLLACDGAEATALYAAQKEDIAVVLTDMMMPLMDGPTTIQVLMRINPLVRIVAASGLNANGMVARAASAGVHHFLPKPYTAETMLQALRLALQS